MLSRQMCADFERHVSSFERRVSETNELFCVPEVFDEEVGEEEGLTLSNVVIAIDLRDEVNGSCVLAEHKSLTAVTV